MKKYLLPTQKNAYKANLHAHSTLSDGNLTPEELAKAYREHGYSVLAITDHEFMLDHSDLNTEDFLTLTSYELQIVDHPGIPRAKTEKCCHMCLYSKDPHDPKHVFFNPDAYDLRRLCKVPERIPEMKYIGRNDVQKVYSVDLINEIVQTANENGMLVSYNHPTWSLETDEQYTKMKGFYAMEIFNSDCFTGGLDEYNPAVYDRMLRAGQRLSCVATDDCHDSFPLGDPKNDSFRGFTFLYAESLTYDNIIAAMEQGDLYASCGPEFRELSYEDGKIIVKTTDVKSISLSTAGRRAETVRAGKGETVNEAVFSVDPEDIYIRITLKDSEGNPANSRGYFLDEFI